MLVRYTKDATGNPVRQAEVYTREEHGITLDSIDHDALFVCRKLRAAGHEAYIVGGAVRDLLLGIRPKDFDIATSAHPRIVKKVLPFSRIIGKRFRLVHVYFPSNKILEIATFRSNEPGDANAFGTLEEDALRRDFSLNALYYCPKDQYVIDHVGGMKDVKSKRLVNVIHLSTIFSEDPVRLLRAIKYATKAKFTIPNNIGSSMKRHAHLLEGMSASRLTEEMVKILVSGHCWPIFTQFYSYKVMDYLLPSLSRYFASGFFQKPLKALQISLQNLDLRIVKGEDVSREEMIYHFLAPILIFHGWEKKATTENFDQIIEFLKDITKPIIPSNKELDFTLRALYREWAVRPPRKRPPRLRGRGKASGSSEVESEASRSSAPVQAEVGDAPTAPKRKRKRRKGPRKAPITPL